MRPRLVSGIPVGVSRRRRSTKTRPSTKSKPSKLIPSVLQLCQCYECATFPGPNPVTGFPCTGRYLAPYELKLHRHRDRQRGVAALILGSSLQAPELHLPIPSTLSTLISPPSEIPLSFTHTPTPSIIPNSVSTPRARTNKQSATQSAALVQELEDLVRLVKPAGQVIGNEPLAFKTPPSLYSPTASELSLESVDDLCALDPAVKKNSSIFGYHQLLLRILKCAHENATSENTTLRLRCQLARRRADEELTALRTLKLHQWENQRLTAVANHTVIDTAIHYIQPCFSMEPATLACYLLVATLHLICHVSIDHCRFVLEVLHIIVQLASAHPSSSIANPESRNIVGSIYTDVRTVVNVLDLQCYSTAYVCCPRCFAIYWIDPDNPKAYPETCTKQETDQEPCGAKLRKKRKRGIKSTEIPVREYLYQNMPDWVGWLYSRPELKEHLDRDPTIDRNAGDVWDIWDAPGLREFLGPDGQKPFIKAPGNEGRLIFSLNIDGFNPYTNKEAGKKVSTGGIYMVCLNLPAALRYKVENMYLVAVIPGPREPSTHEINYLLEPLVNDLLRFWNPGVYYTRTHGHPNGRRVRCAVVPLVCDLPAARQTSGFAHYTSKHFCSQCHQLRDNINDLNYKSWEPRTYKDHKRAARGWLKANTQIQREEWYTTYGVRWSQLLRLPYWDPTRFTIIDSMHAFYLRLLSHHCRSVWGMDITFADGDGITFDHDPNHPTEAEMKYGHWVLENGTRTELSALRVGIIRQLCREGSDIDHRGRKGLLVDRLLEYRIRQGWFNDEGEFTSSSRTARPEIPIKKSKPTARSRLTTEADAEEYFQHATKTMLMSLRKAELLVLFKCKVKSYKNTTDAELSKLSNDTLRTLIQAERKAAGIVNERGKLISGGETKKTRVLGRDVLAEIRRDMERILLPSWVPRAPSHPGEKKWGKFGADQWRSFCLINLPITLIRLWGHLDSNSREHKMLVNFLHLTSAVKLATMRKMTKSRIVQYELHMHQYLTSLLELYPNTSITPYQHLSLHFGELLERFGPTHAWRCFPFERYNYLMQHIPTNSKFGDMEKTMFRSFSMGQRLRALFHIDQIPLSLHPLITLYRTIFKSDICGSVLVDALSFDEMFQKKEEKVTWSNRDLRPLSPTTYASLRQWIYQRDAEMADQPIVGKAFARSEIGRLGQLYQTWAVSPSNSQVVYRPINGDWSAGKIAEIFSHTRHRRNGQEVTETFAVVHNLAPLSPSQIHLDHHRKFPVVGGRLFHSRTDIFPILISIDDIECHFVSCVESVPGISRNCILALPLDKS